MKDKKIPLITRIYSAIADFRIYPLIQKEKLRTAIGYFLKLILIISLVYAICITNGLYETIIKVSEDYNTQIPNFKIEDGVCVADKGTYTTGDKLVVFDTEYAVEDLKNLYSKDLIGYDSYALVGHDAVDVYPNEQIAYRIEFEDLPGTVTKDYLYSFIFEDVNSFNYQASLFVVVYIAVFMVLIQFKLMSMLGAVVLSYMFNLIFGVWLKFKDALKISIYALTLPIIIEAIAFALVGTISESVSLIYQALVAIYIFYALRAIKLDKMILEATKNGILKKVVKNDGTKEEITFTVNNNEEKENTKTDENDNDENKED